MKELKESEEIMKRYHTIGVLGLPANVLILSGASVDGVP